MKVQITDDCKEKDNSIEAKAKLTFNTEKGNINFEVFTFGSKDKGSAINDFEELMDSFKNEIREYKITL